MKLESQCDLPMMFSRIIEPQVKIGIGIGTLPIIMDVLGMELGSS